MVRGVIQAHQVTDRWPASPFYRGGQRKRPVVPTTKLYPFDRERLASFLVSQRLACPVSLVSVIADLISSISAGLFYPCAGYRAATMSSVVSHTCSVASVLVVYADAA